MNFSRDRAFSETGCRKFYPGQYTYGWTTQYGSKLWDNFDDAWEACQSIGDSCGSLAHWGNPIRYEIKSGTGLNAEGPQPNKATKGAWLKNTKGTTSKYCKFFMNLFQLDKILRCLFDSVEYMVVLFGNMWRRREYKIEKLSRRV